MPRDSEKGISAWPQSKQMFSFGNTHTMGFAGSFRLKPMDGDFAQELRLMVRATEFAAFGGGRPDVALSLLSSRESGIGRSQ